MNAMIQSTIKYLYSLPLVFILIMISGCAGPKIAADWLNRVETNAKPLVNNMVMIDAKINPQINNHEQIDESVRQSLAIALENANIFGTESSQPYKVNANILVASQAAWSFGSFNGKLSINYVVLDGNNNIIMDELIYTEAESDKFYFSGAKRHRRSRAVNISKNVLKFVQALQSKFKSK